MIDKDAKIASLESEILDLQSEFQALKSDFSLVDAVGPHSVSPGIEIIEEI